jgi:uncharacterized membrane protein
MMKNFKIIAIILTIISSLIILIAGFIEGLSILENFGIKNIFSEITIGSNEKIIIAFCLLFPFSSFLLILFNISQFIKGNFLNGSVYSIIGGIIALIGIIIPLIFGFQINFFNIGLILLASIILFSLGYKGFIETKKVFIPRPFLTNLEISFVASLSALTAILTAYVGAMFPSPTGGYTHVGDTIIFLAGILFGSKIGGLVGMIGSLVADFIVGYPRWFVSIPAHGFEGIIAGFGKNKNIVFKIIFCFLGGLIMALTYFYVNIFIKGYPAAIISFIRDLFGQALVSLILAIPISKILEKVIKFSI